MVEHFDIGPLIWVKEDINQSLDSVLNCALAFSSQPEDTASMRFSQTYLYQVSGAFDMVGLVGCKHYCNQLENFIAQLEKKRLVADANNMALFTQAIHGLKAYMERLLEGAADIPTRLHPFLAPLMTAMGQTIEQSDLFFPDTSIGAPNDLHDYELGETEYISTMLQQRAIYQKALLIWMQTQTDDAINEMHNALNQVAFVQHHSRVKALWWVAGAFIQTLTSPHLAMSVIAKKVCRKLDQALRQLVAGEAKPNNQLLREMLYFVAHSDVETDHIAQVKAIYSLDNLVDKTAENDHIEHDDGKASPLINHLKMVIDQLHETWQQVSNSIAVDQVNLNADQAVIELDGVLISQFVDQLQANHADVSALSQIPLLDCYTALLQAAIVLRDNPSKVTQGALVEVASALDLLHAVLINHQVIDASTIERLIAETELLKSIETGFDYNQSAVIKQPRLDKETLAAVVQDIGLSLKVVEQSLDTFFRKPDHKATLPLTSKPLKQVSAIFEMLNLALPMQIIDVAQQVIQCFQHADYDANQADFELLAESLALVGLYTDEMPNVREQTITALAHTLIALNAAHTFAHPALSDVYDNGDMLAEHDAQIEEDDSRAIASLMEGAAAAEPIIDQAFDEELLDIYLTEAEELLAKIAQNLQALRVNATEQAPLIDIRRYYHTLKGSGRTVGLISQAEVAYHVECFLNSILEATERLDSRQITQLEKITAAFADWTAELKASGQARISQQYWLNQVDALYQQTDASQLPVAPTQATENPYVLISGKHQVSQQLYEIFLKESKQHLVVIEDDIARLNDKSRIKPDKSAKQAIHTLASNALAAGFNPMGELCRALENWLDTIAWAPSYLPLYEKATKAIAGMWQSISIFKMPRAARALVKMLNAAAEQSTQLHQEPTLTTSALQNAVSPTAQPSNVFSSSDLHDKPDAQYGNTDLLAMFVEEANTILPEAGATLRAWQSTPNDNQYAKKLQRLLHTLKGSARMAGQSEIGDIAHDLEEVILRKTTEIPDAADFETMFIALDSMIGYFDHPPQGAASDDEAAAQIMHHMQPLAQFKNQAVNVLRVQEEILDHLINSAGEVSIIRSQIDREIVAFKTFSNDLTDSISRLRGYLRELEIEAETQMQSRMNLLQETNEAFDPLEFDRFTRLQELTRLMAESVGDVGTIQSGLLTNLSKTEAALQQQSRMSKNLQQGLLGIRMLPFQQIAERLQRTVRQVARALNKSVDLIIEGEATTIDRSVLEKVSPSLEHLLRNAVAHGMEDKAQRVLAGKAETGVIRLQIRAVNDEIQMTLSDDGAGINLEKVKDKAIQTGLLGPESDITEDTLLSIIFEPGFSTENKATQISGRGIGLDVVRNDISGLGGRVDMASEIGKGAIFNIYVPVTQSVAQVLLVRVGSSNYALPVAMIEQAQKIKHHDLMAIYESGRLQWAGIDYPIYHLAQLLNLAALQIEEQPYAAVLLLRNGLHTIALHVDEVIGHQEVVMKEIGTQLARVPGIVGATVSGDGDIILIINPVVISNRHQLALGALTVKHIPNQSVKSRVLVVDDSLTMRKVLARLLEREGYDVQVAKDGMDALELLKLVTPDIILTDIEMPRLDGFGLARNIRDDARTVNTPLIMISSRTAEKHKTLANEIGVDAFFGKPVQDEELLATIKTLLNPVNKNKQSLPNN